MKECQWRYNPQIMVYKLPMSLPEMYMAKEKESGTVECEVTFTMG